MRVVIIAACLTQAACSASGPGAWPGGPRNWDAYVDALAAADAASPPPADPLVFVGNGSMARWDPSRDFARSLQRSLEPMWLLDVVKYADRLIAQYRPRAAVVFAGEMDLVGGLQPSAVLTSVERLDRRMAGIVPGVPIYVLSLVVTPRTVRTPWLRDHVRTVNALLRDYAATRAESVRFVDATTPLLDEAGIVAPRYLADDHHLNDAGFAVWADVIRRQLREPPPLASGRQ